MFGPVPFVLFKRRRLSRAATTNVVRRHPPFCSSKSVLRRRSPSPLTSTSSTTIDLDAFDIAGATMEGQHTPSTLVRHDHPSDSSPLLHIEFETNPVHTDVDYRIHATMHSMEIIYDAVPFSD